jgi:hypothetical protein
MTDYQVIRFFILGSLKPRICFIVYSIQQNRQVKIGNKLYKVHLKNGR